MPLPSLGGVQLCVTNILWEVKRICLILQHYQPYDKPFYLSRVWRMHRPRVSVSVSRLHFHTLSVFKFLQMKWRLWTLYVLQSVCIGFFASGIIQYFLLCSWFHQYNRYHLHLYISFFLNHLKSSQHDFFHFGQLYSTRRFGRNLSHPTPILDEHVELNSWSNSFQLSTLRELTHKVK